MASSQRIPSAALIDFVDRVLVRVGADNEQARVFARSLVWSDRIGRPGHGVWRLPVYVKRIELGLIKCPCAPRFLHAGRSSEGARRARGPAGEGAYAMGDDGACAVDLIDGDRGLGHYLGHLAMEQALFRARRFGIGAIGVHNSNHFGTGAYYVQLAASAGMIGLAMSNSLARVAAHGGVRALFGTNPFAFAAPGRDGRGVLLDMATAAVSGAHVLKCAEAGLPLSPGIAIDADGRPLIDPARIDKGALLPFGGAKGYGITLMIEILSAVLTGALASRDVNSMFSNFTASGGNGHFFIAIDIARFMDLEVFVQRLENLLEAIRASGPGGARVAIPGAVRWEHYEDSELGGVPLDAASLGALEELAARLDLSGPLRAAGQAGTVRPGAHVGLR